MTEETKKLPVIKVFKETYGFAFKNYGRIINILWFPILLFFILALLPYFIPSLDIEALAKKQATEGLGDFSWGDLLGLLLYITCVLVLNMILAVYFLRMAGLGDFSKTGFLGLRFGAYEWKYTWATLKIFLVILIPMLFTAAIAAVLTMTIVAWLTFIFGAVALVLIIWFSVKLYPIIAAAALGDDYRIKTIWNLTNGNFWRIIGASLLIVIPYILPIFIIAMIAGAIGASGDEVANNSTFGFMSFIGALILGFFDLFVRILGMAGMAKIYTHLKK